MIRCSNGSAPQQPRRPLGHVVEVVVRVLDDLPHVLQLVVGVGESHPARDLVNDVLHLLDLPEVIEEQSRLVLVGQADGITVGLVEDLMQGPQDEPVLEERPLADGPRQSQRRE